MLLIVLSCISLNGYSAEQDREADRAALRGILKDFETSINKHDPSILLKHVAPNIIVTFYDATVITNVNEFNDYYKKMMEGPMKIVKNLKTTYTNSAPAVFYGDTAIGYGKTEDHFELMRGLDFKLDGNWSATAIKMDNQWKVVAIHFSTNLFNNALLNDVKKLNKLYGIGGFATGVILMLIITWVRKKKSA